MNLLLEKEVYTYKIEGFLFIPTKYVFPSIYLLYQINVKLLYRIDGFLSNPKKYVFPSIYLLFQIIYDLLYRIEGRYKEIHLPIYWGLIMW